MGRGRRTKDGTAKKKREKRKSKQTTAVPLPTFPPPHSPSIMQAPNRWVGRPSRSPCYQDRQRCCPGRRRAGMVLYAHFLDHPPHHPPPTLCGIDSRRAPSPPPRPGSRNNSALRLSLWPPPRHPRPGEGSAVLVLKRVAGVAGVAEGGGDCDGGDGRRRQGPVGTVLVVVDRRQLVFPPPRERRRPMRGRKARCYGRAETRGG